MQSIGSDIGGASFCTYNQSQIDNNGKHYNLNDTMPAPTSGSIVRQQSLEKQQNLVSNQGLNDTQDSSKKLNKINMEAYQAYYNTNESSLAAGNGIAPKTIEADEEARAGAGAAATATPADQQNMKIINNIMHINHSGANINIMCGGPVDEEKTGQGQQNNFIFNHTAPINLNFYEEV